MDDDRALFLAPSFIGENILCTQTKQIIIKKKYTKYSDKANNNKKKIKQMTI